LIIASWVGALFLILRGNRRLLAIPVSVTGFVIGASPASALNWITNGKILAANTTKNTPPPSLAYLLHAKWATLPHFFGGTTVPARDSWIMIGGACAIAAASYFLKARARAAVVVVSALAMTYANRHALHAILSVYPFDAHGWLVMSPVLALGFLLSPSIVDEPRKRARLFILFLAAFICVVSFAALVAAYPNGWAADGNHEWGPRYWLILFPILAISAAVNWDATFFRADRAQHAFLGASIAAILTVSVAFEIRGLDSIRFCERDVDANRIVLESRDDTPLVTDIFMMSSLAPDLFFSRPSFYFRYGDRARFERWFPMAAARGLTTFDFATFEDLTSHHFFSQPIDGYTFELGEVSRHVRLRVVRVRAIRR
ncbi:MAG: hypothetical protein ACREJX_10530, partial [Polyangiaceae bacterium]